MKKSLLLTLGAFVIIASFTGCKKDDPQPENENELITTIKLTFTEGDDILTYTWKDLTPGTGLDPIVNEVALEASKTYEVAVEFLNESKTPADNITEEVAAEADEHMVFLYPNLSGATWVATDKDVNNLPIGLNGTFSATTAGTGKLRVVLRHQPDSKDGSFAPGSTDVDVEFPLVIE